jgi:phosphatidylserine/phosphatidylglycerophosphate/cardiolipin synthase-like enzyme
MQVIVQPRDGIEPLLAGIRQAQTSVEIIIYRCDRLEIEQALVEARARGVHVHALITYTNREDLKLIKKLEQRLVIAGIHVTRTAEDLVRYHSKMMIIDRRTLFLLTFNFTFLDIHHSRSFGVVTSEPHLVQQAIALFEADTLQVAPQIEAEDFVISPLNSRQKLSEYIRGAERQLLIYDGKLSDTRMIRLLEERAQAGVEIKVIGSLDKKSKLIAARKMPRLRLHVQAIIRDQQAVFFGSQSLRKLELDYRREVGLITTHAEAVRHFGVIFELDWGDVV